MKDYRVAYERNPIVGVHIEIAPGKWERVEAKYQWASDPPAEPRQLTLSDHARITAARLKRERKGAKANAC